ncbi:major histocompatibility complex class I-related gene protein-like isoform X2 [Pseudophryne corroboree]|uniref:major histocompatibility complex class I-related gene protein-like isoform X2 n=1 Tax=Pseudophryne corroboree TaxID=495146 RepID=UPI003081A4DF
MEIYRVFGVLLLFLSTPYVFADSHSHYFFMTVTNDPTPDFPSYYTTRAIDDVTLYWYDSVNEIVECRVPWFKSTSATLLDESIRYHVLQVIEGCTAYENGTTETVASYHYDGNPFISFNMTTAKWIADSANAQYFAERWNKNTTVAEEIRNLLLNSCIPHIQELLLLGNCTFNRREQPVVRVTQHPITNGSSRLSCRAYGHYPKDIAMMWYRNGQKIAAEVMDRVTVPLPDLVYLTSLSLTITPLAGDSYTCEVSHSSRASPFLHDWKLSDDPPHHPSAPSNGAVIASCLAVILLLGIIVFGSVSLGKSRRQSDRLTNP